MKEFEEKQNVGGVSAPVGAPSAAPVSSPGASANTSDSAFADTSRDKNIKDTRGYKLLHTGIFTVLGFGINFLAAELFTYWANTKPWVKKFRETVSNGIADKLLGKPKDLYALNAEMPLGKIENYTPPEESKLSFGDRSRGIVHNQVRSTTEILFMMVSGWCVTLIMAPLASNMDKMAYRLNQWLGRDKDVLTDAMKLERLQPRSVEELLENEVKRRVKDKITAGDVWKARLASALIVIAGDSLLTFFTDLVEKKGKHYLSPDNWLWKAGKVITNLLPESWNGVLRDFYDNHGAGLKDLADNQMRIFKRATKAQGLDIKTDWYAMEKKDGSIRAEEYARDPQNYTKNVVFKDSDAVITKKTGETLSEQEQNQLVNGEQARIFAKDIGWTLALAKMLEYMAASFSRRRVQKERVKAVDDIRNSLIKVDGKTYLTSSRDGKAYEVSDEAIAKLNGKPSAQDAVAAAASTPLVEAETATGWTHKHEKRDPRREILEREKPASLVDQVAAQMSAAQAGVGV